VQSTDWKNHDTPPRKTVPPELLVPAGADCSRVGLSTTQQAERRRRHQHPGVPGLPFSQQLANHPGRRRIPSCRGSRRARRPPRLGSTPAPATPFQAATMRSTLPQPRQPSRRAATLTTLATTAAPAAAAAETCYVGTECLGGVDAATAHRLRLRQQLARAAAAVPPQAARLCAAVAPRRRQPHPSA